MSPQNVCPRRSIITLVAFVGLFSAVCFQMCLQMVCMRGCIITLVAFVWLFSTVRFQMSPQSVCTGACIVTLVALVWLFSTAQCPRCQLGIALNRARSDQSQIVGFVV